MLHDTENYNIFYDNIVVQWIKIDNKRTAESRLLIEGHARAFVEYYKEIITFHAATDIDIALDELCQLYFVKEYA